MDVIWSPSAPQQVARIFDHLAISNPHSAGQVAAALIAAGDSLGRLPHRGRPVPGSDVRELVTVHPSINRFRIARNAVRVLRVRHGSRRPTTP